MKTINILALALLAACSAQPTMEELEKEALETGDWEAVEKRERMNERMGVIGDPQCREGFIHFCEKQGEQEVCECVSNTERRLFH